jgi:hypothetical protein
MAELYGLPKHLDPLATGFHSDYPAHTGSRPLATHALRPKPHFVAVPAIREQRRSNNPKDFISAIRLPETTWSARIPQLAKHNDIDIVDGINRGLLLVGTLEKCNRRQFRSRASSILDQAPDGIVLASGRFLEGRARIEAT